MKEARSGGNKQKEAKLLVKKKNQEDTLLSLLSQLSRPPIYVFVKTCLNNLPNFSKFL